MKGGCNHRVLSGILALGLLFTTTVALGKTNPPILILQSPRRLQRIHRRDA